MPTKEEKFTASDWLRWCLATILAAITMSITVITWAYSAFTPKDVFQMVVQRLDRIENKIDDLKLPKRR